MPVDDLTYIKCLIDCRADRTHICRYLADPYNGRQLWQHMNEARFDKTISRIHSTLINDPPLHRLFDLYLASTLLLFTDPSDKSYRAFIREKIPFETLIPEDEIDRYLSGKWTAVPVIMVAPSGSAGLLYFMAGCTSANNDKDDLYPEWVRPILTEPAQSALRNANQAAKAAAGDPNARFICYPLVAGKTPGIIDGISMGLPLALGFTCLIRKQPYPYTLLATGGINAAGQVEPVDQVQKKLAGATAAGRFSVMLYPDKNQSLIDEDCNIKSIPVANLRQSLVYAVLYDSRSHTQLSIFARMQHDPDMLTNNLDQVPAHWIDYARQEGMLTEVMNHVIGSKKHLAAFAEKLRRILKGRDLPVADKAAIARLITPDIMPAIISTAPEAALKLCTDQLMLANHQGDTRAADAWIGIGDRLAETPAKSGALENFSDYFNHRFVRHQNSYLFKPDLPPSIKQIEQMLEARFYTDRDAGFPACPALGELYGSIAQNLAFCGPAFFDRFDEYNQKALTAFGAFEQPEQYPDDWLRQYNYRVYALIDAGRFQSAEEALKTYLQISAWQELIQQLPNLSAWQHAALCRYIADARAIDLAARYFEWVTSQPEPLPQPQHPWQLWRYNFARMAALLKNNAPAVRFFRESLAQCLAEASGPTIKVMALLPMAGLQYEGATDALDPETFETVRQTALKLNPVYFERLNQHPAGSVLNLLWEHPETLFPFTYR